MRAVRAIGGEPTVVEVDEPEGDWPLLKVGAVGICGSDLTLLKWNLPTTLGHEIAGTLDGRAYCVEPTVRCGQCDQCRMGQTQRCRGSARHGIIGAAFNGGLAERVAVPQDCLVPLPDGLGVSDASSAYGHAISSRGGVLCLARCLVDGFSLWRHVVQLQGWAVGEENF